MSYVISDSTAPFAETPWLSPPRAGFMTITFPARAGPRLCWRAVSRYLVGAPPATVLVNLISAVMVAGPHFPSIFAPTDF